jgi:16S rRNA C1402 (ribose-2'-O) methylase RsmI
VAVLALPAGCAVELVPGLSAALEALVMATALPTKEQDA